MDREHFFYRQEHDLGHVNAISYRINALMTLEERDLIQEALKLYKQKLDEEVSFCKFVNLEKTRVRARKYTWCVCSILHD